MAGPVLVLMPSEWQDNLTLQLSRVARLACRGGEAGKTGLSSPKGMQERASLRVHQVLALSSAYTAVAFTLNGFERDNLTSSDGLSDNTPPRAKLPFM